jgi:predicted transcriptional regulator
MIQAEGAGDQNEPDKIQGKQELAVTAQILVEDDRETPPSMFDIHNNDTKILSLLNEAGSNYSFKGIMRKLDMHQQSLSRALHRLEEMGLVVKSDGGYSLGHGGEFIASQASSQVQQVRREFVQLLQSYIPVTSIRPQEVAQNLVGRWFKSLRWLGMVADSAGYSLQWSSAEGTYQVNLRIISDYIVIETNALSEKDKVDAMTGSYAIFEHIAKLLQNRVGAYSVGPNAYSEMISLRNN